MTTRVNRRTLLQAGAGTVTLLGLPLPSAVWAQAVATGSITMAYPADVPTWDPTARSLVAAQSLYKAVFDQPLTQAPDLTPQPALVTAWRYLDDKNLDLELTFREGVTFHDGSPMTAADFRYSFLEHARADVAQGARKPDTSFLWRRLKDIEVVSPTKAVLHFSEIMPSAVAWLYFLCSFVVPKAYMEKVGAAEFEKKPIGTGPYKVVDYQPGARISLEAYDKYWGPKPAIGKVTIDIARDPTARVAAIESRRADITFDVPIREAVRLGTVSGLTSSIDPNSDIMIIEVTKAGAFADEKVRLAAHHAINKDALSKALFQGIAKPISVPAAHGTAGYPEDFVFAFSEDRASALLKEAGFSPQNPVKIKFATTNGVFPNDFDITRAIAAMWKKVGIDAEIEVIELSTYQERLRAGTLPEATMYGNWGNATGDPEMYGGYLLDPNAIFSSWKSDDMKTMIGKLLVEPDQAKRIAGYKDAHRYAVEHGYTIPLLQNVKVVISQSKLKVVKYANGWTLPQTYSLA